MKNKVLLFGASGNLGKGLKHILNKQKITHITPSREQCDITDFDKVYSFINTTQPNIIIHSAGYVDTEGCEQNKQLCLDNNVLGTFNIVKVCRSNNIRLIYISSEYVFPGNCFDTYTPHSIPNPKNTYGISKTCSEFLVKTLNNYLVIRAPFIRDNIFPYEYAFIDQHTSRQYICQITEDIINASLSDNIGIKHIVGEYQSVYDLAKLTNPKVKSIKTPDNLKKILPLNLNLVE